MEPIMPRPKTVIQSALMTLLLCFAGAAAAQAGITPPNMGKDQGGVSPAASAAIFSLEGRLNTLEKKVADLEKALAKFQTSSTAHDTDIAALKTALPPLKNHTHKVTIYSIDYAQTKVKDFYNQEKQVVVPGPSFGNPTGSSGPPIAGPAAPPF
jgi:hypothetical protein